MAETDIPTTYKQIVKFGLDKDGFFGLICSSDNGKTVKLIVGPDGLVLYPEDGDKIWNLIESKAQSVIDASGSQLAWSKISDKPDLVLEKDLPDFNQFAKKNELPDTSGLAKAATVDAVKTTAESALSTAEKAQSTADANSKALADKADKSAIPSLDGYAKLTDIPSVTGLVKEAELAEYAKKSDIPKLPDLSGYATVASLVDYAKRAELPDFTQFARKSELPVVPTDLVHTADLDKAKADIAKAQQMANDAVTFANNARVTIDTTDLHQIKKPSEYSEGFSYEVKALSDLGIDLTKYDTSVQNGWIGLVKSVQVSMFSTVYVTQTVRVLGSYRPTTFIRNGSGDNWYPFELVTTW